jgi:hypothetical protein
MGSGKYNTGKENDLTQQVADILRRLGNLESGNRIGLTSIDRGQLTVQSGASIDVRRPLDNATVVRIGDLQDLGLWGIAAVNPNPDFPVLNPMFEVGATDPEGVFPEGVVNVIDRRGNFVFTLGFPFGLGNPSMAHNFIATSTLSAPSQSTKVRLRDAYNSNPTTPAIAFGAGAYTFSQLFYEHKSSASPGDPFSGMLFQTELEARRTGGAGAVRVQQIFAAGFG